MDISSNAEARIVWMKGLGNNFLAKDFNDFYGVGAGGQLMTPINFGLELNYNLMFSSVKYGHENKVGNLGSQKLWESTSVLFIKIASTKIFPLNKV